MKEKYCINETRIFASKIKCLHCLTPINKLVLREGYTSEALFQDELICIDMDEVEKIEAKNQSRENFNSSMDSAFLLKDRKAVLVEYRFNYKNLKNLDSKKLTSKKFYSEQIITRSKYLVYPEFYYVFSNSVIEQVRRRFRNFYPKLPQVYKVIELKDLKSIFF
ncbi:hypothetical protein M9417_02465 [Pasteurella multocida]|uniref:hypothetical protein n=1 Tax=Pasteurella multocida TaxID=747 RepID=UPI0020252C0B|nr:hypothetical protein [Pasteurella multocida]URJ99747.1 hypothetical protein M9417_02465 [Pasteurella multocida]